MPKRHWLRHSTPPDQTICLEQELNSHFRMLKIPKPGNQRIKQASAITNKCRLDSTDSKHCRWGSLRLGAHSKHYRAMGDGNFNWEISPAYCRTGITIPDNLTPHVSHPGAFALRFSVRDIS